MSNPPDKSRREAAEKHWEETVRRALAKGKPPPRKRGKGAGKAERPPGKGHQRRK